MIFSLTGIPQRVEPFFLVLDCHGVGYGVRITGSVYEAIVAGGFERKKQTITIITRSIYAEDKAQLFGFLRHDEAELFDFIRSLSGFGPQVAMNLVSALGADDLLYVLKNGDAARLTRVPGIGKTKAEKLCFEAKNKIAQLEKLRKTSSSTKPDSEAAELLEEALLSLGYTGKEIRQAKEKVNQDPARPAELSRDNLQEWIRLYLRHL
ncbi:MAG: helix-hairpin-helix domain-containing protein [Turneriella sp.]|nr:helix-hairpin-helix domain-containing protein [Turneriella sp.]